MRSLGRVKIQEGGVDRVAGPVLGPESGLAK